MVLLDHPTPLIGKCEAASALIDNDFNLVADVAICPFHSVILINRLFRS
jgi:hypothetical protein